MDAREESGGSSVSFPSSHGARMREGREEREGEKEEVWNSKKTPPWRQIMVKGTGAGVVTQFRGEPQREVTMDVAAREKQLVETHAEGLLDSPLRRPNTASTTNSSADSLDAEQHIPRGTFREYDEILATKALHSETSNMRGMRASDWGASYTWGRQQQPRRRIAGGDTETEGVENEDTAEEEPVMRREEDETKRDAYHLRGQADGAMGETSAIEFYNERGMMPQLNSDEGVSLQSETVFVNVADDDVNGEARSDKTQFYTGGSMVEHGNTIVERMKYDAPEDPRNYIINVIVNSAVGSVTLQSIHDTLQWDDHFAEANGTVFDYLQGYQSIFAVSPVDDRVTLRRPLQTTKGRRTMRGQRGYDAISSRIGSVSCSYVANALDIEALRSIYKRRGYEAAIIYDVLHVSSNHTFDLFLFPNGVVVWWGMNRRDHWLVEDDFLSVHSFVGEAVKERHPQKSIDDLFPFWCSYELDERYNGNTPSGREEALRRFSTNLCFDHYLIPNVTPLRSQVMLTVSYSLGRTAIVDFFDTLTQQSQKDVLAIPFEIKGLLDYFSRRRHIAHLEGELHLALMAITALRDTPEFLWEMAWLEDYHELTKRQNSSDQLLRWFTAKSDALLQQLANIKTRRFRLFMLGSDVVLIFLMIADVFLMLSRLVARLYFPAGAFVE